MSLVDRNRAKLRCFRSLLESGVTALHLNARDSGVSVPERFRDDPWLVLNFSYRYNVADFTFDEKEVRASLQFGGQPYLCVVPWSAVFAITDDGRTQGQHWQEDLPADAHRAAPQARAKKAARAAPVDDDALPDTSNEAPVRRGLAVIAGGREDAPEAPTGTDEAPAETPTPPRSTGHLRRVK
jgi:stringent starvation protein B